MGDGGGHFSILPGIKQTTQTYLNIIREKEFVINFLASNYDEQCRKLIVNGGDGVDELETAGLTAETSEKISTPRIKEAFLSFECKLESVTDLSGKGMNALIIGRVVNAGVDEKHHGIPAICKNFSYNIRAMSDHRETCSFARLEAYN